MYQTLVSIVMPTFNSEAYVRAAIESVIAQKYTSWELICVDDASGDGTVDLLRDYEKRDRRISVCALDRNGGPAKARNCAITVAVGRYVAFLDSDDYWREDKLGLQLKLFSDTDAPLVYSGYEKVDETGRSLGRVVSVPESISYHELLSQTVIATCTAIYDTERAGKVLMPDIRKRQDLGLWLKILRAGGRARAINEPLAYLRKRSNSVSSNKLSAALYVWRVYREFEGLSIPRAAAHFVRYAYHASVKARI